RSRRAVSPNRRRTIATGTDDAAMSQVLRKSQGTRLPYWWCRQFSSDDRAPCSTEREQGVIRRRLAVVLLQQQRRVEKSERHPVAAVAEGKQMFGVPAVSADVRQAIGCRREEALPHERAVDPGQSGINPVEVPS